MKVYSISSVTGVTKLTIRDIDTPVPKADEVLVRWHATSLNYHDYLVAMGAIPVLADRIPMSDGAGEIVAIGEDVHQWSVGDRVISLFFPGWLEGRPKFEKIVMVSGETIDGYMCEMSCVAARSLTAIPSTYTYAEAATLPCAALTAWNGLFNGSSIRPGESVLLQGTGGVSIFALQFALAAGARVFATTSSEAKSARLKELGCTSVVNYAQDHKWGKTIFNLSDGGVDHVIDLGGGSTIQHSIEAVKIGGQILSIGILGNGRKGEITFPKLFFKFINLRGLAVGSKAMQEEMISALTIHAYKPIIDRSFAFDQLNDAFQYQTTGQHFGKIVLEW